MSVLIGGEKAWKQSVKKDVVLSYQWVNGEPSMILYPKVKQSLHTGAYAICLSACHQYVNSDGYPDLDYMIPAAAKAAKVMGFEQSPYIIRNIIDAILDGIEDLIKMPPEPAGMTSEQHGQVVGEAAIKVDGKVIAEKELTDLSMQEMAANGIH